jgi:hypothetical protein
MRFGNYLFSCQFTNEALLPHFKGSTFRGVFGRALKNVVCALKKNECGQCLLNRQCVYALVFENAPFTELPEGARIANPPHPFVIEPPLDTETHFLSGSPFAFRLLLFGDVNNSLPYFIYAFEQTGKIGIGRRVNGKRGEFVLEEVRSEDQSIYSALDQKISMEKAFGDLNFGTVDISPDKILKLRIRMVTPLRLKFENRLRAQLPFHILVRAMLRRVSSVFNAFGDGEPGLDYRGMVERAKDVRIVDEELNWFDWERYSFRQDQKMLMGGIVGSVTYEGRLGEFMPLVNICSKIHLGKQTTFGLGLIKAEAVI